MLKEYVKQITVVVAIFLVLSVGTFGATVKIAKTSIDNKQNHNPTASQGAYRGNSLPVEFLPRVNIVNITSNSTTYYNFIASIPMTVFHHNGRVYQSLLTADHINNMPTNHLLADWKNYLDGWDGAQHINFIGNVSETTKTSLLSQYNVSWEHTSNLTGNNPIAIANQIALHDWINSENIIIAPYSPSLSNKDMESITNAAVIASLHNAPVLFTSSSSLTTETLTTIQNLGATNATLVEIGDTLTSTINSQLGSIGVTVINDITNETMVVSAIRNLTGHSTLCSILTNSQGLPAALTGARYGGYILFLPDTITGRSNTIYNTFIKNNSFSHYKLNEPGDLDLSRGYKIGEQTLAQNFYDWLDSIGGNDTAQLETVITFNPQPEYDPANGLSVTFDRAISGDPIYPSKAGAIPGRMPLHTIGNIAVANRGTIYKAIIFSNPRPHHVTLAMNAYEVWHTVDASGYYNPDKWGTNHVINEIFGWPYRGWSSDNNNFPWQDIQNNTPNLSPLMNPGAGDGSDCDPGQFASFNQSYTARFHSGAYPGAGGHPAQPNVPNCGFVNDINNGST